VKPRPDSPAAELTVVRDLRHPLADLALHPAIAFARARGLAVDWLPRANEPLRPPSTPTPQDDRGTRHRRHRAHMIAREIAVYAEAQGLVLKEPYRDDPASAAELAWLFVRETAPDRLEPFLVDLFHRSWSLDLDADDHDAVSAVVADAGCDVARFAAWVQTEGPRVAAEVDRRLADAGVFNVPAFLVEDQVFYGRQHLPMIGWLLDGGRGPVPI